MGKRAHKSWSISDLFMIGVNCLLLDFGFFFGDSIVRYLFRGQSQDWYLFSWIYIRALRTIITLEYRGSCYALCQPHLDLIGAMRGMARFGAMVY